MKRRLPFQVDQDKKVKVEKSAIKHVINHYEKLGYSIMSVEKDNVGWDLEGTLEGKKVHIEVIGLSGRIGVVFYLPTNI